jgi:hypothetical protein
VSKPFLKLSALVVTTAIASCYTYIPAELTSIPQGQEVRVYLTRAAVAALPADVAPTDLNALYVRGRLEAREADSLTVGVPVGTRDPAFMTSDIRQLVKVRTAEVVDVRQREFSLPRTALLVGSGVALGATVITLIFQAENSDDIPDPNPDTSRVPIFSFPMRLPLFGW